MRNHRKYARTAAGNMLVVATAITAAFITLGMLMLGLLFIFGSQRQTTNATDAAMLAVGKEAIKFPYYDLNVNEGNVPDARAFMDVADESPTGDGHKVINLSNINKVWGQALIAGINLDAMAAESKTKALPQEAFLRVKSLRDSADSISAALKQKLETDPRTQQRYKKLAQDYLTRNPDRYLAKKNEKLSDHVVSFLNRGEESNVALDVSMLDNLSSEGPGESVKQVAKWLSNGKLRGYTDDIKIKLATQGELVYHFVPLKTNSAPHLVSVKTFDPNKDRASGEKPFNWKNAVPNAFGVDLTKSVLVEEQKNLVLFTRSAVISELTGSAVPLQMNRGFIRIENANGLNLETNDGGQSTRPILAKQGGMFSAADYANVQLLVQRSMQHPLGGSRRNGNQEDLNAETFASIANPVFRDEIIALNNQVISMIADLEQLKAKGTPDSVQQKRKEIENLVDGLNTNPQKANVRQELIKLIFNNFGTMPDPQRYPLVGRFAATLTTLNDARPNIEKGLVELGTAEHCFVQSRTARPEASPKRVINQTFRQLKSTFFVNGKEKTLPKMEGTMIAGMGVLPTEPAGAEGGQRNPLRRERIMSAAFQSPTPADGGLRITYDGSPYDYLQGDDMSPSDITARKKDGSIIDKLTPTCSIVRVRLIQRLREIDPTLKFSGPTDKKLKNLLKYGFAVEDIASVASNPQPKLLPMGTRSYIYQDKVRLSNGQMANLVIMKRESEITPSDWISKALESKPEADGNTLLLQGRYFDGTNHRLTGVQLNMEGDYGYSRPYHIVTDVCARDRYKWTPSTGANGLLAVLRFETTLNNGGVEEAGEQTESEEGLNFGQILGQDEEYEDPSPCQGTNTIFSDPFGYDPKGLPPSALANPAHRRWSEHYTLPQAK